MNKGRKVPGGSGATRPHRESAGSYSIHDDQRVDRVGRATRPSAPEEAPPAPESAEQAGRRRRITTSDAIARVRLRPPGPGTAEADNDTWESADQSTRRATSDSGRRPMAATLEMEPGWEKDAGVDRPKDRPPLPALDLPRAELAATTPGAAPGRDEPPTAKSPRPPSSRNPAATVQLEEGWTDGIDMLASSAQISLGPEAPDGDADPKAGARITVPAPAPGSEPMSEPLDLDLPPAPRTPRAPLAETLAGGDDDDGDETTEAGVVLDAATLTGGAEDFDASLAEGPDPFGASDGGPVTQPQTPAPASTGVEPYTAEVQGLLSSLEEPAARGAWREIHELSGQTAAEPDADPALVLLDALACRELGQGREADAAHQQRAIRAVERLLGLQAESAVALVIARRMLRRGQPLGQRQPRAQLSVLVLMVGLAMGAGAGWLATRLLF